jgi:hypothetical protein
LFKSSDALEGNYALGLKNIYFNGTNRSDSIRCTFIFKGRPGSLMGSFKNTTGNKLFIRVSLTARDVNNLFFNLSNDSITLPDAGGWRPFIIPIHYYSSEMSYKAEICLFASGSDTSEFSLIDKLSFSTFNGLPQATVPIAIDGVSFEIFQLNGQLYAEGKGHWDPSKIKLLPGIYIVRQTTKNDFYTYKFIQYEP